jgi:hypothetical protein
MGDTTVFLDPTDEREPIGHRAAVRPAALTGTLGIIDISKARGDVFCDELERLIRHAAPAVNVIRLRKPTYTRPAPPDLRDEVAERCEAVIQALAD